MKKNFFKKLSFVLALAMIVSAIAPAAGAFAATALSLNASAKTFTLGQYGGYNFNINGTKAKGWKYAWSSSNEDVATVNAANGVTTAVGTGTATITCDITDKSGADVDSLTASVTVKDNMKSIAITAPANKDTLSVAKDVQLATTFATYGGSTTKSTSYLVWSVDSTKATVSSAGVFNATEAGTYKITVNAFQSAAKAAVASNFTATADLTVKVVVGLTKAELVTPTQIKLTFDSSVKDVVKSAADIKVNQVVTSTISAMIPVKSFDSISADGKTVTFSVYDNLANNVTYTVAAAGLTKDFLAQIGSPVSISMSSQTVPAGTATALAFTMLDQYGVNVASLNVGSVVKSSTVGFTNAATGTLNLSANQVAFVKYSYTMISSAGVVSTISTDTVTVTGVAATITGTLATNLYSANGNNDAAFATAKSSLAIGSAATYLNARIQKSDGSYNTGYFFESLTPSIAIIDRTSGLVTPIAVGTAVVKVLDVNNATVGYASITVSAASATASIGASTTVVKLSNSIVGAAQDSATVYISNYDQYGNKTDANVDGRLIGSTAQSYVATADGNEGIATINTAGNGVTFTAIAGQTGSFTYVVRTSEDKVLTVSVTVAAPGVLNNYAIAATATSADAYVANPDTTSTIDFSVYGMDASGLKQSFVTTASFTITGPTGYAGQTVVAPASTIHFSADDSTGTYPVGTYTMTANIGGINYVQQFTVTNSRALASLSVAAYNVSAVSGSSVLVSIENALELTLGGNHAAITGASYVSSDTGKAASTANATTFITGATNFIAGQTGTVTLFVQKVQYNAGGVTVNMDVNQSITVTLTN